VPPFPPPEVAVVSVPASPPQAVSTRARTARVAVEVRILRALSIVVLLSACRCGSIWFGTERCPESAHACDDQPRLLRGKRVVRGLVSRGVRGPGLRPRAGRSRARRVSRGSSGSGGELSDRGDRDPRELTSSCRRREDASAVVASSQHKTVVSRTTFR